MHVHVCRIQVKLGILIELFLIEPGSGYTKTRKNSMVPLTSRNSACPRNLPTLTLRWNGDEMAKLTFSRVPNIGGTTEPGARSMTDTPGTYQFGREFPTISMQCFSGRMAGRTSSREANTMLSTMIK